MRPVPLPHLVLVGGGHSHVQVLRRHAMRRLPARVTVVVDRCEAIYSGMVPGLVAGQYGADDLTIDLRPLARRAGARLVEARALGVDPVARQVVLEERPPLAWDVASLNIGSTVGGLDVPGVRDHALPTRPIGRLTHEIDALVARLHGRGSARVLVVGAGAGGVELAFALRERLLRAGLRDVPTTLVGRSLLPGLPVGLHRRVRDEAQRRAMALVEGREVVEVTADGVRLDDGSWLPADAVLWATGAAALPLARASGLPVDAHGFVRVGPTLEVVGVEGLYAVGDCAAFAERELPKAGVYAVRMGPVLAENLRASLEGRSRVPYRPQADFLALLNLGDGTALGTKWGAAFGGAWVFRWKDRIDRRFMERFQVLDPSGAASPAFTRGMPPMPTMDMVCGGCAAKVGETALSRALARVPNRPDEEVVFGREHAEDAVAMARGGELIVQSIDAFPAFTDDPWLVGRVAALNALSDLQAKGVAPRFAMALVTVPEDEDPEECLFQVLSGARVALDAAGCTLTGGHTTVGEKLVVGFAVTGFAASREALHSNGSLRPGHLVVLTRPLGTGVLWNADMTGRAPGREVRAAVAELLRGNGPAGEVARAFGVTAATDVTGFGLVGHLGEMLRAAGTSAVVGLDGVPLLPGVEGLLARGERSTFHEENRKHRRTLRVAPGLDGQPAFEALFDPQTAGGLLLGVEPERAGALLLALHRAGDVHASVVARVTEAREDLALFEVVARLDDSGRRPSPVGGPPVARLRQGSEGPRSGPGGGA